MDVICPLCGEPISTDEFHDVPGVTYGEAWNAFKAEGCAGIGYRCNATPVDRELGYALADIYAVMGDDVDGIAALLDDFAIA